MIELYFPTPQLKQTDEKEAPIDELYFPTEHPVQLGDEAIEA
jgi:hypothetical protein